MGGHNIGYLWSFFLLLECQIGYSLLGWSVCRRVACASSYSSAVGLGSCSLSSPSLDHVCLPLNFEFSWVTVENPRSVAGWFTTMPRVRFTSPSKLISTLPTFHRPRLKSTLPDIGSAPQRSNNSKLFNISSTSRPPKFRLPPTKSQSTPGFAMTLKSLLPSLDQPSHQSVLPGRSWQVNREQNTLPAIKVNPADIDPSKDGPILAEEARLKKENAKYASVPFQRIPLIYPVLSIRSSHHRTTENNEIFDRELRIPPQGGSVVYTIRFVHRCVAKERESEICGPTRSQRPF